MQVAQSQAQSQAVPANTMSHLVAERDLLKQQSAWLLLINQLHKRLSGAVDLASMIEGFSVWLMPLVQHDFIACRNHDASSTYSLCSGHGPRRSQCIASAANLLSQAISPGLDDFWFHGDLFACRRHLELDGKSGCLVIVRHGNAITPDESSLLEVAISELIKPLERALKYEDLFDLAHRDPLTGLPNRRILDERLPPLIEGARRYGYPLSVASLDLDHFKSINDNFGHLEGDRVLKKTAAAIACKIRGSDILVRIGGDEFLIFLPHTDLDGAESMAELIIDAVNDLAIETPEGRRLTVSIGLSQWQPVLAKNQWLQQADQALYQAKNQGRNQSCRQLPQPLAACNA